MPAETQPSGCSLKRILASTTCLLIAAMVVSVVPAGAQAEPPNDNYLSSLSINEESGALPLVWHDGQDTTAATLQSDLFNPQANGTPGSGGGPESDRCGPAGPVYGRTVWYDFKLPQAGGVQIQTSGFDTAVAVYQWDFTSGRITRRLACQDNVADPLENVLLFSGDAKKNIDYTVQVGGVAPPGGEPAGGGLGFDFHFFPDRDEDGTIDALDRCRDQPGIEGRAGCPPALNTIPRLVAVPVSGGVRIVRLSVAAVPRHARVEGRCCHVSQVVRGKPRGVIRLKRLIGRFVPSGTALKVLVTLGRQPSGRFRFGATGNYFKYPVRGADIRARVDRCLPVGSRKPRRRCR